MGFRERIEADESTRFEEYGVELAELQRRCTPPGIPIARALHVKAHLGVAAEPTSVLGL